MPDLLDQYGYLAIFVALMLENTVVVGLVFPGIGALAAAGYFAGSGDMDLGGVLVVAWLGTYMGDAGGFALGRFGLGRIRLVGRVLDHNEARVRTLRSRRPVALLFFQFVSPPRTVVPMLAGAIRMDLRRWFAWDAAATTLFTGVVTSVGYTIGTAAGTMDSAQTWVGRLQMLFVFIAACWLGVWIVRTVRVRRRHSAQK